MFFFFKQKTAYEMRISDWSSDVCSSDLAKHQSQPNELPSITSTPAAASSSRSASDAAKSLAARASLRRIRVASMSSSVIVAALGWTRRRSEEHTSELQSLMRISYAVVCLKKKKNTKEEKYSRVGRRYKT